MNALELAEANPDRLPLIPALQAARACLPVLEISEADELSLRQGKRVVGKVSLPTAVSCGEKLVGVVESAGEDSLKSLVIFSDEPQNV